MLQQFTNSELLAYNRTQLWQLCRERGLKCYPKTADCVEAICQAQQSIEKVAVAEILVDEQAVAQIELVAHIEAQAETIAPEITTVEITFYDHEIYAGDKQIAAITHDPDDFQTQRWVVMVGETEVHRDQAWAKCFDYVRWHYKQGTLPVVCEVQCEPQATEVIEPLAYKLVYVGGVCPKKYHVYRDDSLHGIICTHFTHWSNGIDNVQYAIGLDAASSLSDLIGETKKSAISEDAAAALNALLLPNSPTVEYASPEIEIDSDIDADFGVLYRVWNSRTLLGTFYQAADDKWVAQPLNSDDRPHCDTAVHAQLLIVALAGLLVADSTDEVEAVDLLDKPFDELTVADWQAIKQQALQAELVAA